MKIWLYILSIITLVQANPAAADQQDTTERNELNILHWVNKKEKKVQFLANAKLEITFQKINLDKNTAGLLYVSLENSTAEIKANVRSLELSYPGYEINRIWTQKSDNLNIDIPSLGLSAFKVNTMPGADGPYFSTIIEISNAQVSRLEQEIKTNPSQIVFINGKQVGFREKNILKERVILPYTTCIRLADSKSLYNTITTYVEILNENKNYPYLYTNTRAQLEKQILVSCLNIEINKELDSFSELLERNVSLKPNALPPMGETYAKESIQESLPIRFVVKSEVMEEK